MMTKKQEVKDILVAIHSVKRRAMKAEQAGDMKAYISLGCDLLALYACLSGSTEGFIDELDLFEMDLDDDTKMAA